MPLQRSQGFSLSLNENKMIFIRPTYSSSNEEGKRRGEDQKGMRWGEKKKTTEKNGQETIEKKVKQERKEG